MSTDPSSATSSHDFNLPGSLAVGLGPGGLPSVTIDTPQCAATQSLHGATVTGWTPAGQTPVLFTSREAVYQDGKAIRGGVPICFPWFGDHPLDPDAPAHGLVRALPWQLVQTAQGPDGIGVHMLTHLDQLRADYRTTYGEKLTLNLSVTNTSDSDQTFEAALHTYFVVGDIHRVRILGLEHADYLSKVEGGQGKNQGDQPVTFSGETDRIYQNTQATCVLEDPALGRAITVEKLGSDSTVVWNPWVDKSARLADFGDDEWTGMCCIESANIGDHAVTLAPGDRHTLRVVIKVTGLE
ncbi:MAG: D-hexose-6-phosphate mutarotase [Planctomycetota bacterium]